MHDYTCLSALTLNTIITKNWISFSEFGLQMAGRPMLKNVKLGLLANLLCFAIFEHQILSPLKSIFIKPGYYFFIHVSGNVSADEKNGHASIDLRKAFVELPFHFIDMKKLKHLYRCIHYHTTCQNRSLHVFEIKMFSTVK